MMNSTEQTSHSAQLSALGSGGMPPSQPVPADDRSWVGRTIVAVILVTLLGGGTWGAAQLIGRPNKETPAASLTAKVERAICWSRLWKTAIWRVRSTSTSSAKWPVARRFCGLSMTARKWRRGRRLSNSILSALEESINQQRIAFEKARAAKIQAEKDFAAAKLAVDEYLQGTYVQAVQDQDAQITIAEENLRSAQNCAGSFASGCFAKATSVPWTWRARSSRSSERNWNWIRHARPKTCW